MFLRVFFRARLKSIIIITGLRDAKGVTYDIKGRDANMEAPVSSPSISAKLILNVVPIFITPVTLNSCILKRLVLYVSLSLTRSGKRRYYA